MLPRGHTVTSRYGDMLTTNSAIRALFLMPYIAWRVDVWDFWRW